MTEGEVCFLYDSQITEITVHIFCVTWITRHYVVIVILCANQCQPQLGSYKILNNTCQNNGTGMVSDMQ